MRLCDYTARGFGRVLDDEMDRRLDRHLREEAEEKTTSRIRNFLETVLSAHAEAYPSDERELAVLVEVTAAETGAAEAEVEEVLRGWTQRRG